ncbi:oxidoreductase, NAD-binding domain protein [Actinomyces urogenitalis DSM 15434]|uniref:Oxidoreductase, NAD-binding domain protein n=2 Tax=Actinomyces urogenitalis TaxID=103621 RepID=C0W8B8_9ACTO|nr:Gfo/Idh/MocA family oxidoreductase [Actinomyces urogenitalis]ETJ02619.1 MAG: Oxidoreductase protein [Actinomyces urogenitalis DORA_12]EEH65031.1 oxidoreductase, NAD-binding domain protein [Actinomyces urogenitalis DSM 15434]MBS5976508.1 Gfo/Idh/MocA family oxidoreductase [Actinomyces urogenitalis]MCI7456821.1 Gfo/Idh/MocA family oxidoreductase [Actinomyces urogenitalis]MDK8237583.1 Gfo/Idh/MocA family oxidoreductase [Actinomyces urogenitalis]
MSEKNLRVGLIGLGSMGRHHARVIRATPGMDLVAVADPAGDKFGVAGELPVLPDVAALIDAGLDAAMVAVPTIYHEDVALALAEAGVHTMVEKPIAATAASGRRVAEAFDKAGLVGAVGYVERCNPALRALRERLDAGELGQVYQVLTRRQGPFPARISDVGVVKDLATHDIDLTAWVAGAPYESVSAQVAYRSGRENEDMVVATGRLANGVIVSHTVNWLTPFKERVTIVTGEKGAFVADTLTGDLTFYANGTVESTWDQIANFRGVSEGDVIRYAIPKREPLALEQEHFRDAVRGDASGIVTMAEGVATLDVIDAVLTSAAENRTVTL